MGNYDDIINLPYHVSDYHKPMPRENRAAQFAPFAALTGHDEAIEEVKRITEPFKELSEEEKNLLSRKLKYAIDKHSIITITHYIPDQTKQGGSYKNDTGKIKKWDEYDNSIFMLDGQIIPVDLISYIDIKEINLGQ